MQAAIAAIKKRFPDPLSEEELKEDRFVEKLLGILALFTSMVFLGRILIPTLSEGISSFLLYSDLTFCIIFISLYFIARSYKAGRLVRVFIILIYTAYCVYPLFFGSSEIIGFIWLLSLPFFVVFLMGYQIGMYMSLILMGILSFYINNYGFEVLLQFMGAYLVILTSSYYVCKSYYHYKKNQRIDAQPMKDALPTVNRDMGETFSELLESNKDFHILYQRDVLKTLEKIPNPDAVLSYILLEGISNIQLFDSEQECEKTQYKTLENYLLASCSIEDFFVKVESVIELRNAKKNLEFNKIQTQMNRVIPDNETNSKEISKIEDLFENYNLSEREIDITRCILSGMTNKEISLELYISFETVKTHVRNILKKCEVSSRIELIKLFTNSVSV